MESSVKKTQSQRHFIAFPEELFVEQGIKFKHNSHKIVLVDYILI